MGNAPSRTKTVYFLGAGFSKAFGLPLTSELLEQLEDMARADDGKFLNTPEPLTPRLVKVFKAFYPDGTHRDFRPSVVDFFATLSTYVDLSRSFTETSFPGGNPGGLLRLLKLGLARVLINHTRGSFDAATKSKTLAEIVKPGNIIITSNWDPLVEAYAAFAKVPLRRSLLSDNRRRGKEVALLKLHGSVDWLLNKDRKTRVGVDGDFRPLSTLSSPAGDRRGTLPAEDNGIVRVTWDLDHAWQRIKARVEAPHIVTMATGKMDDLGPLEEVWRDAFSALSMAKELHIMGYSMPEDDTEIRTLLRAGVERGSRVPTIYVHNPSPDVHDRVRRLIHPTIKSTFKGISA